MPGADFYRALATVKFFQVELMHERDAHNAMKLCFEKIHKSLDMYKGHYINRLRFHMNRHHTEYLRKVRAMRKDAEREEEENKKSSQKKKARCSMRVAVAQDLAKEVKELKDTVRRKDLEIDRLTMLLDEKIDGPITTLSVKEAEKTRSIEKISNPFLPSSSDDDEQSFGKKIIQAK
jgi:hypothetical protein